MSHNPNSKTNVLTMERRRSSVGTKRPSMVDPYYNSDVYAVAWSGTGLPDRDDVIEESGAVTSPKDTTVLSSSGVPILRPVTEAGPKPRIRQVQVREQGEAFDRAGDLHCSSRSNPPPPALVSTARAAPSTAISDHPTTGRTAKRRKSVVQPFDSSRTCSSSIMSSEAKREEADGDAIDRDGGIPPPRRVDNVPTEIVEHVNGSPDMSDTSVSSSRSSTASNADDRQQNNATADNGLKTPSPPAIVLTQLARQLEYYFSSRNLARDTYMQTLRSLNDGCVPVAILSNFAKVKAMLSSVDEEGRFHAILQAAAEHSDLLQVCSIETSTGKIATDDTPSSAVTILAVGPVNNEPLMFDEDDNMMCKSQSVASLGSSGTSLLRHQDEASSTTNTIILREVHPDVTEAEIRELFSFVGCPAIESVRPDVAHCWFVTLDTTSRDDMLRVMMTIRMQMLHGDYVQARLKATARAPVETAPPMPLWPAVTPDMLLALEASAAAALDGGKKKRRKKKKKKHRKKAGAAASGDPSLLAAVGGSPGSPSGKSQGAPPPSMGEDDFPTIQVKKVEFVTMPKDEKPDEEKERTKSLSSDAASTATTNSSSLDSYATPKPFTGYAAALLKAPSPVTITEPLSPSPTGTGKNLRRLSSISGALDTIADVSDGPCPTPAAAGAGGACPPPTVLPPLWGRGRSFADMLREDRGRTASS